MSTSEGWDKFIDPVLLDHSPYCDPHPADGSPSDCGNTAVGRYMLLFCNKPHMTGIATYLLILCNESHWFFGGNIAVSSN